tara:strand:- start:142 stop:435 length:294 start_codon:yes stop_codon:yes gene_type:complete
MWLINIVLIVLIVLILNNNYEGFQSCDYRGQEKGRMCQKKWGKPKCNLWSPIPELKKILSKVTGGQMRGYYSNPYFYELGYESKTDEPKGVNSTFFS